MPSSDWASSFYGTRADNLTANEINTYSQEVAKGLEGGKKKKPVGLEKCTKEELLKKAKKQDIKGRHGMNKGELVSALRNKRK